MNQISKIKISGERGFASMIIAAILVIVLSLLTVGFAELMRHNETQQLNRQLSDQAYYAAESGVNDAVAALNAGYNQPKTNCSPLTAQPAGAGGGNAWEYLSDNNVAGSVTPNSPQWTCLLMDLTPNSLVYNPVGTTSPKTFIFEPVDGSGSGVPVALNTLTIYWQGSNQTSSPTFQNSSGIDSRAFPPVSNWGSSTGVLRISITPLSDLSRQGLINNTYTAFLYPSTSSGSGDYSDGTGLSGGNGNIINGGCSANPPSGQPLDCSVTIANIPYDNSPNGESYLMTLRSIYSPSYVYIVGCSSSGACTSDSGDLVDFNGAQTMIDSTGKDLNVLKRIQVRVPDRPNYPLPGYDAEAAGNICKTVNTFGPGTPVNGC